MQRKCISIMLMVIVFMFLVVGCGSDTISEDASTNTNGQLNMEKNTDDEEVEDSKADKEALITVEELPYEITMLEPDSSGTRYMEATFTNNSDYIVTGYSLTILLKEENEKTYLSIYDTVKPGETSPKFETFAPESGEEDDMEVLEYEIIVQDEDGTEYFVNYDVKLDKYEMFEAIDEGPEEVLVKVEELPYEITMLEPDSSGTRYMEATFTNNSNYIVTGYSLTILLKEENEKTYLSIYDTVKPGETSPKFETFAPESGEEDDIEVLEYELTIQGEDGTEYFVNYDVKLDKYEVIEIVDD